MIGTTIAHYRIVERLGGGGMGVVYRAEDLNLGRPVAVKFLAPLAASDPEARSRFLGEARAAAAVVHPNVCGLREIGETLSGDLYMVMDFCEGRSLRELLRAGPLPFREAAAISLGAARALAAAHGRGVVHRDVKPANLMVGEDGRVRVVDFGLARFAEATALTRTGGAAGTAAYMAPEQVDGTAVDQRADIWALGVVLYECLAGTRPFSGGSEPAVLAAIRRAEPRPLAAARPGVPSVLASIVARALQKDPPHRWQTAGDVAAALEKALEQIDAGIARPARLPLLRITRRAARLAAVVALGLIVLGGAGLGLRTLLGRHRMPVVVLAEFTAPKADESFATAFRADLAAELVRGGSVRVLIAPTTGAADYRLEGSIVRTNGRLAVWPLLVDARTGEGRWGTTYDRPAAEEVAVLRDIAAEVARMTAASATAASAAGSTDYPIGADPREEEALRLSGTAYLQGTADSMRKALDLAVQARSLAPGDSFAAGMVPWRRIQAASEWNGPLVPPEAATAFAEAREARLRFPGSTVPASALAVVSWRFGGDLAAASHLLDWVSAQIGGDPDCFAERALIDLSSGNPVKAVSDAAEAYSLNPSRPDLEYVLALARLLSGDSTGAARQLASLRSFRASWPGCDYLAGMIAGVQKRYADAAAAYSKVAETAGNPPTVLGRLAWAMRKAGHAAEADAVEAGLPPPETLAYPYALSALGRGDEIQALSLLRRGAAQGDARVSEALYMPEWQGLNVRGAVAAALREGRAARAGYGG